MKIPPYWKLLELGKKIANRPIEMLNYVVCKDGFLSVLTPCAFVRCPLNLLDVYGDDKLEGKLLGIKTLKAMSVQNVGIICEENGVTIYTKFKQLFYYYAGELKGENEHGRQDFYLKDEDTGCQIIGKSGEPLLLSIPDAKSATPAKTEIKYYQFGLDTELSNTVSNCFLQALGKKNKSTVIFRFSGDSESCYPKRALMFPITNTSQDLEKSEHGIIMPSAIE
jgi:hypothetical protein